MEALSEIVYKVRHASAPRGPIRATPIFQQEPDRSQAWEWMRAVRAKFHAAGTVRIWRGSEPTLQNWDAQRFARVEAGELDAFTPPAPHAALETLEYPLRIVSLPGDRLQVGDRRMIRPAPTDEQGEFDVFLIVKRTDDEDQLRLEIGGTQPIHSIRIGLPQLHAWAASDSAGDPGRMAQVRLRCAELSPSPVMTLEPRFDALLAEVEDARGWLEDRLRPRSLRTAHARIQATQGDEDRFARWIRSHQKQAAAR